MSKHTLILFIPYWSLFHRYVLTALLNGIPVLVFLFFIKLYSYNSSILSKGKLLLEIILTFLKTFSHNVLFLCRMEEFTKMGAEVMAMSTDSVYSHKAFAKATK